MSHRSGVYPQDNRAWMLAIGRRLRADYDAVAQPLPERLAALLKQLETPVTPGVLEIAPSPTAAPVAPRLDPDGHRPHAPRPAPSPNVDRTAARMLRRARAAG